MRTHSSIHTYKYTQGTHTKQKLCSNHERDWLTNSFFENTDSGGECGIPYYRRFPMPRKSDTTPYYSFDYGLVHFVVFSTEHNFTVGSPQHLWVEEDLRSVDRTRTPWLIVTGHRPAYVDR